MRGILLVTEDPRALGSMQSALVREGYRVAFSSPDEDTMLEAVGNLTPEVAVVDCRSAVQSALDIRNLHPGGPCLRAVHRGQEVGVG